MPLVDEIKGASAPFSLVAAVARERDDLLLARSLEALRAGCLADALLDAESVCRRQPSLVIPATLRAKLLQIAIPAMATKGWYAAWCRDPLDPGLQDAMLEAFLASHALEAVRTLGPAFLPARCQSGQYESLISLLRAARVDWAGACWKSGGNLQGRFFDFSPGKTKVVELVIANDDQDQYTVEVPTDGSLFTFTLPRVIGTWSVAVAPSDQLRLPGILAGSPLVLGDVAPHLAEAKVLKAKRRNSHGVHVIIPVYLDRQKAQACIESVLASVPLNVTPMCVTVIEDASPDPELRHWLGTLAGRDGLEVISNPFNLGFIETCNRGLRLHTNRDALLLNADAMVHGNWLDRMHKALYAQPEIASVTPWSNNGEVASFPTIANAAPGPSATQLKQIDDVVATLSKSGRLQDAVIPTGCGFALLMRRSVLNQIGLLDGVALNRGYSEEVDWCLRAAGAGYRHRLASGVFIAHAGTASFGYEKKLRVAQNRAVIQARYPDFYARYKQFLRQDPIKTNRTVLLDALELACPDWLAQARAARPGGLVLPTNLPQPLPTAYRRIAVWHYDLSLTNALKVLLLARQIASKTPNAPALRLLIIGSAGEALWRTGVVDVLPSASARDAGVLDDAKLLGLCGCNVVLSEDPKLKTGPIMHLLMGSDFNPEIWLAQYEPAQRLAA